MPQVSPPNTIDIERIAVCGLGLIGGSVVRALRAGRYRGRITGFDVDAALLQRLCQEGWIDEAASDAASLFASHDLVVMCQPVEPLLAFIETHGDCIATGRAVGIDVASVKVPVMAALRRHGDAAMAHFVPSHPIAGKAIHGWDAGEAELFKGKHCVLTPEPGTGEAALRRAQSLWSFVGARMSVMSAARHDAIYAAISHLPQVLSYAYLHSLAAREGTSEWLAYQGSGFKGFTRLGASDAELWADIAVHNAQPLIAEIDHLSDALGLMRHQLSRGDQSGLAESFALAREFHLRNLPPDEPLPE
ncbi:prephenate dehydrogenase [Variovorax paradoxus]|nr:prephenate dehydrogenase [Variovorax paradoxus]